MPFFLSLWRCIKEPHHIIVTRPPDFCFFPRGTLPFVSFFKETHTHTPPPPPPPPPPWPPTSGDAASATRPTTTTTTTATRCLTSNPTPRVFNKHSRSSGRRRSTTTTMWSPTATPSAFSAGTTAAGTAAPGLPSRPRPRRLWSCHRWSCLAWSCPGLLGPGTLFPSVCGISFELLSAWFHLVLLVLLSAWFFGFKKPVEEEMDSVFHVHFAPYHILLTLPSQTIQRFTLTKEAPMCMCSHTVWCWPAPLPLSKLKPPQPMK